MVEQILGIKQFKNQSFNHYLLKTYGKFLLQKHAYKESYKGIHKCGFLDHE